MPALEDTSVQGVTAWIFSVIWEEEFRGFSYGFRPGRSPHHALDAGMVGIHRKHVHGRLDADIQGLFDHVSHAWLLRCVEHRMGDTRVIRLIQPWLTAGVVAEGRWTPSAEGVPQGGLSSPVRANISLQYAFDLWAHAWRKRNAHGDGIVVRDADDIVLGFEHRAEAEQFQGELSARLATFDLTRHADKTRLLEFGRFAVRNRGRRGQGKPATFDFLGFTHMGARERSADVSCGGRRCSSDCGPSFRKAKRNCGDACTIPFPNRADGCARFFWATLGTLGCL